MKDLKSLKNIAVNLLEEKVILKKREPQKLDSKRGQAPPGPEESSFTIEIVKHSENMENLQTEELKQEGSPEQERSAFDESAEPAKTHFFPPIGEEEGEEAGQALARLNPGSGDWRQLPYGQQPNSATIMEEESSEERSEAEEERKRSEEAPAPTIKGEASSAAGDEGTGRSRKSRKETAETFEKLGMKIMIAEPTDEAPSPVLYQRRKSSDDFEKRTGVDAKDSRGT